MLSLAVVVTLLMWCSTAWGFRDTSTGRGMAMMNSRSTHFISFPSTLPLCLAPTFKTTTVNDPTAGMSDEEIVNYVSNVGGGLCGSSELVKTLIGLSLNLSLIIFGIFTVSYVIVGSSKWFLEKQVEDSFKDLDRLTPAAIRGAGSLGVGIASQNGNNASPDGLSRAERRLKQKIKDTGNTSKK